MASLGIQAFSHYTTSLFFRQIQVIGEQNVPKDGPCLIYGNHNNQFIDGLLLTSQVSRKISFVAAAVSMRRPIIGQLLRASQAIPVQRPNDIAEKGPGKITKIQNNTIYGECTQFTKIKPKSQLKVLKQRISITQIISDTELKTKTQGLKPIDQKTQYKIIPHLQHDQVFQHVWSALKEQKCIGIFPQGGSHDKLSLLPFKAGICIMALGAMQKYGVPVTLVPAGFNYYNPQKFRSKVIIQFGTAYHVSQELIDLYKVNQKQAISKLLQTLEKMLKSVKIECQTFNQLSTLFLCRQLYTERVKKDISMKEKLQLNKRFAKGFDKLTNEPKFKDTHKKLQQFNFFTKANGLSIKKKRFNNIYFDIIKFLFYFLKLFLRMFIALPGLLLMGPTTKLISIQTQKQRQKCVKSEDFDTKAIDIVGSQKVLLSMIYFPITTLIHALLFLFCLKHFTTFELGKCIKLSLLVPLFMPLYSWILVNSYDSLGKSFSKLKFLFVRLFRRSVYKQFEAKKKQLRKEICQLVDTYGKQVIEDFDEKRIIRPQQQQSSEIKSSQTSRKAKNNKFKKQ